MKIITNQSPTSPTELSFMKAKVKKRTKSSSPTRLTLFVLAVLFFYLFSGYAQAGLVPCGGPDQDPCQLCHFFVLFDNIVKFLLVPCSLNSNVAIVPLIATLFIVLGGAMFFAAAGNPAKISGAKSLLISVAIGLFIIYGAYLLISLFFTVIGVAEWTGLQTWFEYPCP